MSTDDAQVEGIIIPIRARVSGLVERVLVEDKQSVQPSRTRRHPARPSSN